MSGIRSLSSVAVLTLLLSACNAIQTRHGDAAQDAATGFNCYEEGDYNTAFAVLQHALKDGLSNKSDLERAHKYLAFINCAAGREDQCREEFRAVLAINPGFELTPAEAGHPIWGPIFRSLKNKSEAMAVSGQAEAPAPAAPGADWMASLTENPVRLDGASFATNSSRFSRGTSARLYEILKVAATHPEVKLEVSGHTDSRGSKSLNQRLSDERANAVKNWLVGKGIKADRITAVGYADTRPIADNGSRAGRAANRRVEVLYVLK